ncbi:MAG: response regulator, partial [Burkholderiales bacterium]|nr:response regulator [Burkholderiales bacterium]
MTTSHVLIVDDEADIRELLVITLMRMGIETTTAQGCEEAISRLKERPYDLCLTDMRLPDGDGMSVLTHIAKHYSDTPVAVITAYGSTDNAVAALKAGAFDYISKPIQLKQLREVITAALNLPRATGKRAEKTERHRRGPGSPPQESGGDIHTPRLLGDSAPIAKARDMIGRLARSQAPVHIAGESGTGKEVAARMIHADSSRRDAPFVPVNCGAIPENLMESEFFGYR